MFIFDDKNQVYLSLYSEEADVAAAADFATENKVLLRLRAADMTKKVGDEYICRCCGEQKILARPLSRRYFSLPLLVIRWFCFIAYIRTHILFEYPES